VSGASDDDAWRGDHTGSVGDQYYRPSFGAIVRGRVTAVGDGHVRVEYADGDPSVLEWPGATDEVLGAWVELVIGNERDVVSAQVLQRPAATFPKQGGDWLAFHRDDRLALRRLKQRAIALGAIRSHFSRQHSLEVDTPLAVPSPGLDLHLSAFEVRGLRSPRWLITSPEYQMKRLLAAGVTRIHQIARCFRADERGARHEPEFTMLEWYRAFEGSDAMMRDTEELVAHVARALNDTARVPVPGLGCEPAEIWLSPPWDRLTVDEALRAHAGTSLDAILPDEEKFFFVWSHEVEPKLGRERPVFVIDWPASMASLARLHPDRPAFADRFEAYVCGVELCNGFGELIDPVEQRVRLVRDQEARRSHGLPVYPIDERFLGALEEGLPPCAGNALGVDRLVALLVGAPSIGDVMAFGSDRL